MNFDFLVFPSPKCTYSPEILGKQLIFIPKYDSEVFPLHTSDKAAGKQEKMNKVKEIQLVSKKNADFGKVKKDEISEFSQLFIKTLESCEHVDENEEFAENSFAFDYPKVSIKKYSEVYCKNLSYAIENAANKVFFIKEVWLLLMHIIYSIFI